jgi:SAM-dependent methyltransferase
MKITPYCKICGSTKDLRTYSGTERLLGLGTSFEYIECPTCGCLQIKTVPPNLNDYYPNNYYSFNVQTDGYLFKAKNPLIKEYRNLFYAGGKTFIGFIFSHLFPIPKLEPLRKLKALSLDYKILDVGCGNGGLVRLMHSIGFKYLHGCDPYLSNDIYLNNNCILFKSSIFDLDIPNNSYDIIMAHHSLEHIPEQKEFVRKCANLLKGGGILLIRIPIKAGVNWKLFRTNWYAMDPPRHLFLHTIKSTSLLIGRANLKVRKIYMDGTETNLLASLNYTFRKPWIQFVLSSRAVHLFTRFTVVKIINLLRQAEQIALLAEKI